MTTCHVSNRFAINCNTSLVLLVLLGSILLSGCQQGEDSTKEPASANTFFPINMGESTLQLQLALTPAEQQKGLMFRKELPKNHGMLFLAERPKKQGFWMKNTSLPLDIGYLDASGQLMEIHKLFPFDETGVASRSDQILIAIETNRDWYVNNEIRPGAQLDMAALKAAIVERGFSIAAYAIED